MSPSFHLMAELRTVGSLRHQQGEPWLRGGLTK
jgi:hypothetical protein